ncbi:F-type H+-transporting ATPase subunit a [Mycoplasmoides fastidiosum]|uniref:F-type H+-transporting ATPase subunit a n=1 Tax=Mycoplasmoides fastidiosum TaxID=92758 RepID=A0ABU0LYI5_9BACT|nr:FoF1 ATP synthase subunit a [Mycoplasmoides fastidiosum]MDQ0513769.1 F-type H+-transporting ATPase subunit a [Mycoplasmoides fastidiosum]UUD37812.1 F0F1 ATP synthase subunit A [Mycoplasmoides fastidiosum]
MNNSPQFGKYATQPTEHIWSFIAVTIFVLGVGIYYYLSIKKLKTTEVPRGLAFFVLLYIDWVRNTVVDMLGKRYETFTWYFLYIFTILWSSNLIGIAGLESLGSSFTVPLSLALICFFGTFYFGIKYQKWHYLNEFTTKIGYKKWKIPIPDPLKWIGKLSQNFSLMFRYWGNMFAGSIILGALYELIVNNFVGQRFGYLGATISGFVVFPLHMYFDMVPGLIQPLIFMMLTLSYWTTEANMSAEQMNEVPKRIQSKRFFSTESLMMPDFI